MKNRKILVLTGTRADFGKLKPLMLELEKSPFITLDVFVTGMHMLSRYGSTHEEVEKSGFSNIYKFINQNPTDTMDQALAKTIVGLSDYTRESRPDLVLFHGDRVEALAAAIVGSMNNILTGHIEGGEVSGTIDESIRHSTTKLSNLHFVANEAAQKRLIQLGEEPKQIFIIGSPDIDIMNSNNLPSIDQVKEHYEIPFDDYSLLLFHSVTTELDSLADDVAKLVNALIQSDQNYIVVYPNNDTGTDCIFEEYKRLLNHRNFRLYPSMRFESYLTLLRNSEFIIGNSSAGVREAPHYGIPCINLGSRQKGRASSPLIINSKFDETLILQSIQRALDTDRVSESKFGDGLATERFKKIVLSDDFWSTSTQKYFTDII
jgi:UDP-N-acetylglucosamine 2-epimerase (hydrolysing)